MFKPFVFVISLVTVFSVTVSAIKPSDSSLLRRLDLSDGSPAFKALFPPSASLLEAPLAIRFLFVQTVARYELAAACHPTALSFFGTKDSIQSSFCKPTPRAVILAYLIHRINSEQFPVEAAPFGAYLAAQGLTPFSDSTDVSSTCGWANNIAKRANKYFSSDGWNSQGDPGLPSFLRKRYGDTSGYLPQNKAETPANALPMPLRWQPLIEDSGATGGYKAQIFTVPHLGSAKPLVLSKAAISNRTAKSLYLQPNSPRSLTPTDNRKMQLQLQEFLKLSSGLTAKQRFLARWWENKRVSLGSFLPFYSRKLGLSSFEEDYIRLAQGIAQHDSLIVGWHEKTRNDLVRPITMIQRYFSGRKIMVFVSEDVGVREINGEDYEPFIPVQAHSEFPSGSALLCSVGLESLELALRTIAGDKALPPYQLKASKGTFGFPHKETINVRFGTLTEAANNCGDARLWAGVHFPPSIDAGNKLAAGIGHMAFEQVQALVSGQVPRSCTRCEMDK